VSCTRVVGCSTAASPLWHGTSRMRSVRCGRGSTGPLFTESQVIASEKDEDIMRSMSEAMYTEMKMEAPGSVGPATNSYSFGLNLKMVLVLHDAWMKRQWAVARVTLVDSKGNVHWKKSRGMK